jgi:excisionase family DNA binding protein
MQNGKGTAPGTELLAAADVAGLIGVKETTVYKWCKEGRLPCLKVGKHWRVRRGVLEDFLKASERPATLAGRLGSFLAVPDSVLAVAQNADLLHRIDAAFFRVGEERGGLLVKFFGGEKDPEDELRAHLEQNGLEVGRLEREGRFLMRPEGGPRGRGEQLGRLVEERGGEGRTVWASFDWARSVDLEAALEQQRRLTGFADAGHLVVKTAALEETLEGWPASQLRRVLSSHSAVVLASEDGLSLSRATPMPPS